MTDSGGTIRSTGLYNVSNTCYLNSVLQALCHVRGFRECLLGDEAGTYLYAAGKAGGSLNAPSPTPTDEILSFPGFKKRRKHKRGESSDGEEAVVPFRKCSLRCFCQHHYFTMGLLFCCLAFGIPDQVIFHVRPSRCMIHQSGSVK